MSVLSVSNLSVSFVERVLFKDITFDVNNSDKIGFVGANGVGKTTVFKILSDSFSSYTGNITKNRDTSIAYMEQHACNNPNNTIENEILSVFDHLKALDLQLEKLSEEVERTKGADKNLIVRQIELTEKFQSSGGLTYKSRARSTLMGMGFSQEDFMRPVGQLSGGQRSKLSLAKLLLSNADVLLLDEPTNHLDIPSVSWLESFIKDFKGAVIVISHDRYFLDKVTTRTMELENKKLTCYDGNYSVFLEKKKKINEDLEKKYNQDIKEIKRIEGIVEQQKRWGRERNFITAASKQKHADRLKEDLIPPEKELEAVRFSFKPNRQTGKDVLICENISKAFDENRLFSSVNLHIKKGERVFILGPNGCGKTTFLKIITGVHKSDSGSIRFGANVDMGYFDQTQGDLDLSKAALDEVWDTFPMMTQTQVRSALGTFLLKGDDVFKPLTSLSGGERARIALIKMMLKGSNFLLLDEPTNHLDTSTREVLENTLLDYEGTILCVSHDRYFINKLADRIIVLGENGIEEYLGNYDDYYERTKNTTEDSSMAETSRKKQKDKPNEYLLRKAYESEKRKLRTKITRCEERLEELEAEISTIKEKLLLPENLSDFQKLTELSEALEKNEHSLEQEYDAWANYSDELNEMESNDIT